MTPRAATASSTPGDPASVMPLGGTLRVALWLGLAFAFAPALRTILSGYESQPWTRGTLVFPVLAWLAARSEPPADRTRAGWPWVLLGIGIELIAIGGGITRAARLGLVVAAIGLCRATGSGSLRVSLLLAFVLPLPHAVMELASPALPSAFASAAAGMASRLGFEVVSGRSLLSAEGGLLRLSDADAGLGLLVLFVGLAGFAWLRAPMQTARRLGAHLLIAASAALALQLLAMTWAACLLARGSADAPEQGRAILDHLPWLATWAAGILLGWVYRPGVGSGSRVPIDGGLSR